MAVITRTGQRFLASFAFLFFVGAIVGGLSLWARAGEAIYELKKAEVTATVGVKSSTSVIITGKNGWHVNEEAPFTMKLAPQAGIAVEKNRLTRTDLAEKSKDLARFDVAFTASEPGKRTIDAEASFVMCQEAACRPVKEKISLAVDVSAAPTSAKRSTKKR